MDSPKQDHHNSNQQAQSESPKEMKLEMLEAMKSALAEDLQPNEAPPNPDLPPRKEPAKPPLHILEDYTGFARSRIWDLQRRYYEQAGAKAWGSGVVPHYVTSNAFIAQSYARIALATCATWRRILPEKRSILWSWERVRESFPFIFCIGWSRHTTVLNCLEKFVFAI
jgi:hypothetical protein